MAGYRAAEEDALREAVADAYQAVGAMASSLGVFDQESVQKLLTNLDRIAAGETPPHKAEETPWAFPELREECEALRAEVEFLLERLKEWSDDHLTDESVVYWFGHVVPSLARLRGLLERKP